MNTQDTKNLAVFKECVSNINLFAVRARSFIRLLLPAGREVYYRNGKMPQYKKATVQLADIKDGQPCVHLREINETQTHVIITNLDEIELGHPDTASDTPIADSLKRSEDHGT